MYCGKILAEEMEVPGYIVWEQISVMVLNLL